MTSIIDELRNLGLNPKFKSGFEYSSPCPWCGGKDRFLVWTDSQRYWCRQCGVKGDLIQFLRDFKGLSFIEAKGCTNTNIDTPKAQITSKNKLCQPELWQSQARVFVDRAFKQLLGNRDNILKRLEVSRGIKPETAAKFKLGYCHHDFYINRKEWGLEEKAKENGQLKKLWLPKGLIIPKFNNREVTRIRVRRFNSQPKYYILPGSETRPLILGNLKAEYAILIESELDAILLEQEIKEDVLIVATGSVATKLDSTLLKAISEKKVLVSYDNDQAGIKAVRSDIELLNGCYLPPVDGKDITESFLSGIDLEDWFNVGKKLYRQKLLGMIRY